jgi:hypothetical protein
MAEIAQLQQGSTDTLVVAARGNEIIDAVNALMSMQIVPQGAGSFECTGTGNAILTITGGGSAPADINQAISDFVDTYLTLEITCNTDGTISASIVNSYGT